MLYGPHQVTFNSVDLGGIESIETSVESRTAEATLINGVTLRRDVGRTVSVIMTLVETAGLKTALAGLFPAIYTTATTKAQVLFSVNTCGAGAASGTLTIASDCDTGTEDDLIFYGARPNLEGIEVPNDGPRRIMIRFEIEGDATGKLFQIGSTV